MPAPDRSYIPAQEPLAAKLARRFDDFEAVLRVVEDAFADDRFSSGFGKFREAVNLGRGISILESQLSTFAIAQAERWMPKDWRLAKSLLLEAGEVNSKQGEVAGLLKLIQQHEQEESIRHALKTAEYASSNGMATVALERLAQMVARYPSDLRIQCRLQAIEALYTSQSEDQRRREAEEVAEKEAEAAKSKQLLAEATKAKAREFERVGFYAEALEHWTALREIDPLYPELEREIARCTEKQQRSKSNNQVKLVRYGAPVAVTSYRAAKPASTKRHTARRWGALQGLSKPAIERLETVATIAFTATALLVSGWLVWTHFSHTAAKHGDSKVVSLSSPGVLSEDKPAVTPESPTQAVRRKIPPSITHPPAKTERPNVNESVARTDNRKPSSMEPSRTEIAAAQPQPRSEYQAQNISPPVAQPTHADSIIAEAVPPPGTPENRNKAETETGADNEAWLAVDANNADSIQTYLDRFPAGENRPQAMRALANIRTAIAKRQSSEVMEVIRQYASAWSARDVDSILAIQRSLNRRKVKAELSPIKSLVMNISPAAEPTIEGERATLRCKRQVSERFDDGVEKRSPEQIVTFVLARQNGTWRIESASQ